MVRTYLATLAALAVFTIATRAGLGYGVLAFVGALAGLALLSVRPKTAA